MPTKHYDQLGRLVGQSYTPEEVAATERANAEAAEYLAELLWNFAPFSPFAILGFASGMALHTNGVHPLFSIIAGLSVAAIPSAALWKFSLVRKIYAWILATIVTVTGFIVITDRTDLVWGIFGAIVVAALAGLYAYFWSESEWFEN